MGSIVTQGKTRQPKEFENLPFGLISTIIQQCMDTISIEDVIY
jgi:hypothetical protein